MKLTRREFIKVSVATVGMMVVGCATEPVTNAMVVRKAKPAGPAKGEWVSTACQGCTQWCAIQIFVQDGRAVRVRGNPLSKTNHGYVCPRGHLIPQQTYDPDRIKVPMKRTNAQKGRGVDPKFVPISWDEALDIVADKMMELRKNNEAHKLTYIRGRYSATSTDLLYGTLPEDLRDHQLLLAQRHLRRSREDGAGPDAGLLRLPRLRPRQHAVPGGLGHRSARLQPHGAEHHPPVRRNPRARHGHRGRPAPVQLSGQGAGMAADQARHRRRAGRRHRPCAVDPGAVEQGIRRRLQGRQEPVRRRQDRRRGRLRREGDVTAWSSGGTSSSRTARRPGRRRKR